MSEKGKHLAERIIEICTLTNTRCRTVGHCDTCKVPSGNRNAKHSKEECKDWNCPEHHYQPAHKILGGTVAKFLEQYFKNLTVPNISEAEAFYLSEEIAKAAAILSENPTLPYEVVWERIHDEPSGDGKGGACGATGTQTTEGSTGLSGASLSPTAPETPEGILTPGNIEAAYYEPPPDENSVIARNGRLSDQQKASSSGDGSGDPHEGYKERPAPETPEGVKPGGSLPLGDKGTQQMFGELLFQPPTPETLEDNKKYGCPKSEFKNDEYFCSRDGTRCHTACAWFFGWRESKGAELIAWCAEHGRETVKKIIFGHFNSKVSGFAIFFECGGRQWYKLPFLLDPVFTRPSKSSDGEHAGAGYGAQGEPAPSHTTDVLGLETPASKSSEGRLCKRLNAIDDSRCERPEDDPIHDPRTAGAHVYDPLPPDDSIDTCCYICAAHPYAWLECKGTRGDGDCSKCTPCPIFKPRSPAAATGAAAVTPIVGSAPALAETAGDTEWHSIRYYDNEKDEGVKHPTCVSLAEAKAKLAAAEKHGLKMWEDGVATANKQDAVRVERIKELEASLAMAEDAANKGDKARKEAAGMEERIAELEARLKDCEQCNLIRNAVVSEYEKEKVGLESRLAAAQRPPGNWIDADTATAMLNKQNAEIGEKCKRIASLERILGIRTTERDVYNRLLNEVKEKLAVAQQQIEVMQVAIDTDKARLAAALRPKATDCAYHMVTPEQFCGAKKRIAELETSLKGRDNQILTQAATIQDQTDRLAAAERERDGQRGTRSYLQRQSNERYQRIQDLEARLKDREQTIGTLELRFEDHHNHWVAENKDLEARLAAADDTILKNEAIYQQNIGKVEHRLVAAEAACDEGSLQRTEYMLKRIAELEAELDDSDKCYEEDRKTITSLLEQRDKLAQDVEQLRTPPAAASGDGRISQPVGSAEPGRDTGCDDPAPADTAGGIKPGVYWAREISRTREDLRKKHNLPEWMVYQMEWDGYHWSNKSGWTHITMEQFVAGGWQLGPPVEGEPTDDKYHEVR